jgi:hypothetical protein
MKDSISLPRRRPALGPLVVVAAASFSSDAAADAVARKPIECPPGTFVNVDHNDTWCQAVGPCTTDAECAEPERWGWQKPGQPLVCREQPLCIEERHLKSVSGWSMGQPIVHEIASATCGGAATCAAPATCVPGRRCVPAPALPKPVAKPAVDGGGLAIPEDPAPSAPPRSCGCTDAGAPIPFGLGTAAGIAAALGLSGRRRR